MPEEVPAKIARVYRRASRLHDVDNVACAAFSRTCLEKLLDDRKVPKAPEAPNLAIRIEKFLEKYTLPPEVAKNVTILREMGNFIHLNESLGTHEIVEVSSEEALWALDILESLFQTLYVTPEREKEKRGRFQDKLKEVGKAKRTKKGR